MIRAAERTATLSSSAIASFLSDNTSTRLTTACFSNVCWSNPSCVPEGRLRIRIDRLRISALRPIPVSGLPCLRFRVSDVVWNGFLFQAAYSLRPFALGSDIVTAMWRFLSSWLLAARAAWASAYMVSAYSSSLSHRKRPSLRTPQRQPLCRSYPHFLPF